MSQFSTTVGNLAQVAQSQHQFKRKNNLNTQGKQTEQRIAGGNSRTPLRDRRRAALIRQGVDPDQLIANDRTDRFQNNRRLIKSRNLYMRANRLRRDGNDLQADALEREAEGLRSTAEQERTRIAQNARLLRPTLSDLPAEEQAARVQAGRESLNAQLPRIAQRARGDADAASASDTRSLAEIGRRVHQLEFGRPAPPDTSDAALAALATSADGEVVDQVTRGVGLPRGTADGLRRRAGRLDRLAQDGIEFDEFTPSQRADSPGVVDRVRTGQEQDAAQRDFIDNTNRLAQEETNASQRLRITQNNTEAQRLQRGENAQAESIDGQQAIVDQDLINKQLEGKLRQAQLEQEVRRTEETGRKGQIKLDVNLATSAVSEITQLVGGITTRSDHDTLDRAVDMLNSQIDQLEGSDASDIASLILDAFEKSRPGITFGEIDFDTPFLHTPFSLGIPSFNDSNRANRSETKVQSLINRLRALASGVVSDSSAS